MRVVRVGYEFMYVHVWYVYMYDLKYLHPSCVLGGQGQGQGHGYGYESRSHTSGRGRMRIMAGWSFEPLIDSANGMSRSQPNLVHKRAL